MIQVNFGPDYWEGWVFVQGHKGVLEIIRFAGVESPIGGADVGVPAGAVSEIIDDFRH